MAVLNLMQLQDLLFTFTVGATGLDPKAVRHSYQSNNQPAHLISENLVYINIMPVDDPIDKPRHITYSSATNPNTNQTTSYTRLFAVDWVIYGPNGLTIADDIRYGLFLETLRGPLKSSGLYPLTGVPAPQRGPYEFNNQWWERYDLRAYINVETTRSLLVPTLASSSVDLYTEDGLYKTINTP